ncbi:hypothetical protein EW146_g1861 [Bondarzewia mesenterica]|uniref:CST complex subunit STN1 n=1 Tax=Bondarzewia mesenterica TaxID=1095465 RepID=A0A4S4M4R6_9AGAM|nr:hypothetical protein EW146_g1861 [Bondarzewia mesenterica]
MRRVVAGMSCTSSETISTRVTTTVVLSPSKKRRVTPRTADQRTVPEENDSSTYPTHAEIWKWCLKPEATALCFVRDVFAMCVNKDKGVVYYMLGHIPCRTVHIVGVVVGVSVFEARGIYQVDDGTGVIDCILPHPDVPKSKKLAKKPKELGQHDRPDVEDNDPLPDPVANVGQLVRVIGRIRPKWNTKVLHCDQIGHCGSMNDEVDHWRRVIKLHKESYSSLEPFVIPTSAPAPIPAPVAGTSLPSNKSVPPETPVKKRVSHEPQTPLSFIPPTTPSTASTSAAASSPTKSNFGSTSPPRLRHPSRLHSRDLTPNTFRIYVKHYMDFAPLKDSGTHHNSDSDTDSVSYALNRTPATPTKSMRTRAQTYGFMDELTPRASKTATHPVPDPSLDSSSTPRATRYSDDNSRVGTTSASASTFGFTLSYLRRVPELSELAFRVVKAEARRREKEARKSQTQPQAMTRATQGKSKETVMSKEGLAPKMKRLFVWAILKLFEEGSIILWDGPVRPISTFYGPGREAKKDDRDDAGELSDPREDEEAYIPLTPAYLAHHVEDAIEAIMFGPQSSPRGVSVQKRVRCPGPTKDDITRYLRKLDGRWDRVGAWAVQDALEWLKGEGKAWCFSGEGGGRWELCL